MVLASIHACYPPCENLYSYQVAISLIYGHKHKGVAMSNDEAAQIMDQLEARDNRVQRREFIARMERKLYRKERNNRSFR